MTTNQRVIVKTNWKAVRWIVAGVFLPWILASFFMPLAVSLVVGVCAAGVCVVLTLQLAREVYVPKRRSDDDSINADEIAKIRAAGLHTLLDRWSSISHNTNTSLQGMHHEIDTVMGQTEQAVINIGNSFHEITTKTTAQMEYALGLLKATRHGDTDTNDGAAEGAESLTDFIRSYENLLSHMSNKLLHFSTVSLELVQGQKKAQQNAGEVDGLLSEMETIARRISLLALNTSVASGGVAASERAFVEMSDKIRELSQSAAEFNRRIRSHMQGMKTDLRSADESMANMAHELKDVARIARITQQRLEHLKNPLLNELSRHLSSITAETRVLNKKLQVPDVKNGLSENSFRVVGVPQKAKPEPAVAQPAQPAPQRQQQAVGNDIELF